MDGVFDENIHPCKGCEDYEPLNGCKSKGGCAPEAQLKLRPCYCGGEMKIKKVAQNGGMDGTYYNWELTCSKCGLTKTYAADDFYSRKFFSFEEVVNDWNLKRNAADAGA